MRSFEEILQEHWDDAEGEMTFDDIIIEHNDFMAQFDDNDKYLMGVIDDPFNDESYLDDTM